MSKIYMRGDRTDNAREITFGSDESMTIKLFIGSGSKNNEEILTVKIEELDKGHFSISAAGRASTAVADGEYNVISAKGKEKRNK